jgi:predicted RNase H-like HicB family nuclease
MPDVDYAHIIGYGCNSRYSEEDGAWVATTMPDLPGCSAYGDTAREAAAELRTAVVLWLQTAAEIGIPIPEPILWCVPVSDDR